MIEFLDWWMVPTTITLGLLIWVFWTDTYDGFGGREIKVFQFLVAIIVSLAVWLVWSLVT